MYHIKMEIKPKQNLYPSHDVAPSAPPDDRGHGYRLHKINEIQKLLENERDKRKGLAKKYHRANNIVSTIDAGLVSISMVLGVGGIGLLSTIIATPLVIAMEATSIWLGLLSICGTYASKKLSLKGEKHLKIKIMAEAKINTIQNLISKALKD